MMNIKPISGSDAKLILLPIKEELKTKSGIILSGLALPDNPNRKPKALVKEISEGFNLSSEVSIGDVVLYEPHSGVVFEWEGIEYIALKECFLIAKVLGNVAD